MKKKLIILSISLLVVVIISIIITSIISKDYYTYDLPNNITVMDLLDSKNIFVKKKDDNNIYKYNLKTNACDLFKKAQFTKGDIVNIKVTDKWIVWIEEQNDKQTIYTENRKSNKITSLYESNSQIIQIDKEYLLYLKVDTNKTYIILKNLNSDKEITLDEKRIDDNLNMSIPHISNNKVVWSKDSFDKSTNLLLSNVLLYDINTQQKKIVSNQSNIDKPIIYNDILIATRLESNKDYTKTSLVMYDFNKSIWNKLISQESDIYKNLKNVSIDDPIYDDNLLSWWDNYSTNMYIYNIKNKKTTNLTKDTELNKINQIYFIKNNIIFYRSVNSENTIQAHKCIVFK